MKRIINTLVILSALTSLFSCNMEDVVDVPVNEAIVLDLSSGLTKAETDLTKPDTPTESYVHHIDVFIFDDNAGRPAVLKHYDRYTVNNAPQLTLNAKRTSFVAEQPYHVYLVANSNLSESEFSSIEAYDEFVGMKQTDELLHLTGLQVDGAPEYFLMDAKATDVKGGTNTNVVLYDNDPSESTNLYANLRRAAAKVVINITAGEDVTFTAYDETEDGKPVSDGGLYYIQNLPYQAFLLAEARADDTIDSDVVKVRNTEWGYDGHFKWTPETSPKNASLVTYVYPNSWSSDIINRETCVVVNLPMVYTAEGAEPVEYHNSWYKIHMTGDKLFRRNNYYEVNVNVNRPGATSETVPVDIENVYYAVEPWEEQSINVGGVDRPKYLSVNKTSMEMHNVAVDASTLEFASSSPVTITVSDVYYYNKFGQKTSVTGSILNSINGRTDGGIAGNITVNSPVPVNNAIRYFTLTVTNAEGLSRTVHVVQYPLEYITNQQGWYSYRSDFHTDGNSPTTYENKGSRRVAADWSWGSWTYSTSAQNNYFFGSKVSNMHDDGTSKLYYYYWSNNSSSVYRSEGNLTALKNARMYHVQITASSGKYTVGIPKQDAEGYTDAGQDNAKLVSPSFMIASQLGATQPPSSVDQARKHCREYVEVHDPDNDPRTDNAVHYDNWRLPTAAEIQIIIDFQYVENAAMDEVLSGKYYWSATGQVENPGSTDSNVSQSAVRCIRDVY
jgi:hypothetical protein